MARLNNGFLVGKFTGLAAQAAKTLRPSGALLQPRKRGCRKKRQPRS